MARRTIPPGATLPPTDPLYDVVVELYLRLDAQKYDEAGEQLRIRLNLFRVISYFSKRGIEESDFGQLRDETVDILLKHINSGKIFNVVSVEKYFWGIVRWRVVDYFRKKKKNPELLIDPVDFTSSSIFVDTTDPYEKLENDQLIKHNMKRLSPRYQEFLYYYLQGMTYKDISVKMGIAVVTCGGMLFQIVHKMRAMKKKEGII